MNLNKFQLANGKVAKLLAFYEEAMEEKGANECEYTPLYSIETHSIGYVLVIKCKFYLNT
jgi:hypothetical protein